MTFLDVCEYARISATYVALGEIFWIEFRGRRAGDPPNTLSTPRLTRPVYKRVTCRGCNRTFNFNRVEVIQYGDGPCGWCKNRILSESSWQEGWDL